MATSRVENGPKLLGTSHSWYSRRSSHRFERETRWPQGGVTSSRRVIAKTARITEIRDAVLHRGGFVPYLRVKPKWWTDGWAKVQARLCTEVTDQNCTVPLATSARMMCGSLNALQKTKNGKFYPKQPLARRFSRYTGMPQKVQKAAARATDPPFPPAPVYRNDICCSRKAKSPPFIEKNSVKRLVYKLLSPDTRIRAGTQSASIWRKRGCRGGLGLSIRLKKTTHLRGHERTPTAM